MSPGGLKSLDITPKGRLIVLGETPLMGVIAGKIAIEVCDTHTAPMAKLWTLYEDARFGLHTITGRKAPSLTLLPYSRICADAPHGLMTRDALQFWVNPQDPLTQYAGLGSQWLERITMTPRNGLWLTHLNVHMLNAKAMSELKHAGLLNAQSDFAEATDFITCTPVHAT